MKAQSAVEYLIIIGFVSIAVTAVFILAYYYASVSNDQIKMNQIDVLAKKIISDSESVFYAGNPSQTTSQIYVPKSVTSIELLENELVIKASLSSGEMIRAYKSRVILSGNINSGEGFKNLIIKAELDKVSIS